MLPQGGYVTNSELLLKLQHATPHCNTLPATNCNTLQHTATHCNTLQHAATHSQGGYITNGELLLKL